MPFSQNGWQADASASAINIGPFAVAGVSFPSGVVHKDGAFAVLEYIATQYHYRVEKLHAGWCWGYYFRNVKMNATDLSNHSSGTAIDINAPLHPYGRPVGVNFSTKQIATVHEILAEVNSTKYGNIVRWGGDYRFTVDAMHFEIVGSHANTLAVAKMISAGIIGKKIGTPTKVIVGAKPAPSDARARKTVREALGTSVVNLNAIHRLAATNNDVRDVQRVLNAWYPGKSVVIDGVYGDQTYALLDYARKQFGIESPVSNPEARAMTLRKLGLTVREL